MTFEPQSTETTIATLVRVRPDMLEVRYRAGCTLTLEHMGEVQEARRRFMGETAYGMLTVIPEDVDFQLNAMHTDHMAADRSQGRVIATAVVAKANMIEMLVKLYFSYFPQLHRVLVVDSEQEARTWLDTQLAAAASTGS